MEFTAINKRYSELAASDCCLSCGGAINYAKPALGEVCVDLGSGRGTDVLRMAEEVGADGFVYGIDISDGMLDKARANAEKFGIANVKFIPCELENSPSGDFELYHQSCSRQTGRMERGFQDIEKRRPLCGQRYLFD